jgi:hypothetical protein
VETLFITVVPVALFTVDILVKGVAQVVCFAAAVARAEIPLAVEEVDTVEPPLSVVALALLMGDMIIEPFA